MRTSTCASATAPPSWGAASVHRSFELPGVVLEETGFRTRFTPVRDVDGVLGEFARGPVSLRGIARRAEPG